MVTVHTELAQSDSGNSVKAGELWMDAAAFSTLTGWTLKPEGFCKADICVPLPGAADSQGGTVNASAFWQHMGNPVVSSEDQQIWFLGEGAGTRNDAMLSLEAPDFTLPDFSGKLHSLTDYRRQKILLITWASW
ncbi:MAG: hypothetical protein KDI36_16445 [Pseudomonadales bacterium]|nr:hypothetical protein [Pseudomonadales bacterium]